MTRAREEILGAVRRALDLARPPARRPAGAPVAVRDQVVPARARVPDEDQAALFVAEAERVNATVDRVAGFADVPGAIARYLAANNLPSAVKAAPDPDLAQISWAGQAALSVVEGPAGPDDPVSVTSAFAGVAETGSLALLSGPHSPTLLNYLPDTHIVVLARSRITGTYEDVWNDARGRSGGAADEMPRAVNWITGPSRTADIEQELLLGAHGPRRLHVVVVNDEAP